MTNLEKACTLANNPSKYNIDTILSLVTSLSDNEYQYFINAIKNNVVFFNVLLGKDIKTIKKLFGDDFIKLFKFNAEDYDSVAFINAYRKVYYIHDDEDLKISFMKLVDEACLLNKKIDDPFCNTLYEIDNMSHRLLYEHLKLLNKYGSFRKIRVILNNCSASTLDKIKGIITDKCLSRIIEVYLLYFDYNDLMIISLIKNNRFDTILELTSIIQDKFNYRTDKSWYELLFIKCRTAMKECPDLNLIFEYVANISCLYQVVTDEQDYFEELILNSNNLKLLIKFWNLKKFDDYINSDYSVIEEAIYNIGSPEAFDFLRKNCKNNPRKIEYQL